MYPSFTSLSQRERKRNELLEKAKRRVAQANAKREMYSDAAWSSDVGKIIDVNRNSKVDAQTQAGEPDINKPSVLKDAAVGEEKVQDQQGIDATTEPLIEPTVDEHVVESIVEEPSVVEPIINDDDDDKTNLRDYVRELYRVNPLLADLRINPLKDNGDIDYIRYIGKNGFLYSSKNINRKSNSKLIDWNATYERIKSFIDSKSWIVDLFRYNPNWELTQISISKYNKIQPIRKLTRQLIKRDTLELKATSTTQQQIRSVVRVVLIGLEQQNAFSRCSSRLRTNQWLKEKL
jgi:hypothetical protein